VLWTTWFMLKLAFIRPVIPPSMNANMARICVDNEGSFHGTFKNQAAKPVPPRRRAPISSAYITEKAVARLGKNTANVSTAWANFHWFEIPGSVNW
jgi:hypothetical protein